MEIHLEIIGWLREEKGTGIPEDYQIPGTSTVEFLIKKLDMDNYPIIILVNNQKVERNFKLKKDDSVKIIPVVGGG